MKHLMKTAALVIGATLVFSSCSKVSTDSPSDGISNETLNKIYAHGFGTSNVQKTEDGYLVEGDILLTDAFLNTTPGGNFLRIANVEQYRTTNLVTGLPRVITISSSGNINANASAAIDVAIARYNAENLQITMQRVASNGNINIRIVNGGNYIASAGFPTGGNPYGEVKFNRNYQTWGLNTLASVFAHEMGHCIGMRHTDYMDRSYSCGGSPTNEGASTVGAILIPGTPSGPDPNSWMLSCIGNGIDRPFNANDRTALNYLY